MLLLHCTFVPSCILHFYMSVCLFVCLCFALCLCICFAFISVYVCVCVCLFCLFVCLSVCLSVSVCMRPCTYISLDSQSVLFDIDLVFCICDCVVFSARFYHKVHYALTLEDLSQYVDLQQITIPEAVLR